MSGTPYKLYVSALTETSEKDDTGFLSNVELDDFVMFHTASNSSKGGTAIYASKYFDMIERLELNSISPEYESTWIEIKNKRSKNIVIASIYRHNNFKDFFEYIEKCLNVIAQENKELYMW